MRGKLIILRSSCVLIIGLNLISLVYGSTIPPQNNSSNNGTFEDKTQHFKDFSQNLLIHSDLDEFSLEKGAAISHPFGVGYMLANINEKVWNVSNKGLDTVLHLTDGKIADHYQTLIEKLQKSEMSTSSTLFTKDQNVSFNLPQGSRKLKTQPKYVDFIEDWKTTWLEMNEKIANQTNGRLSDSLIPKGGWWGGAFYYFTMGAFINTNHFKGSWDTKWSAIGEKKFYDGLTIPFFETEGKFPILETENYTAVAIKLKDQKKTVIFVLPKVPFVPFLKSDMPSLVKNGSPKSWNSSVKDKKIQIPLLNVTLLDQHMKKLEALGAKYTFCVDETDSQDIALNKGPYFMSPIVQSHHIELSPEYFEVASATASSLNSEEQIRKDIMGPPNYDEEQHGEVPPDASEYVLPMEMDPSLMRALEEGQLQLKKVDVVVGDEGANDTISASASSVEQVTAPFPVNESLPQNVSSTKSERESKFSTFPGLDQIQLMAMSTTQQPPTTPFIPEAVPENTLRFDRPFFWYLYDDDMGPLWTGTIHSLATYQREYGIETEEDIWLFDAYKVLLINCP